MSKHNRPPINIAVVGHTNTGKTSLIRTLLRSKRFGKIANAAGTTRHVERASILAGNQEIITLYDTPGLEDACALLEELSQQNQSQSPPHTTIQIFLSNINQYPDFEQEAKVLQQGQLSDALLYVIDVRSPLLEKYQHEIHILSQLGKPIIPVFNFVVGQSSQLNAWRAMMIQYNLHSSLEFDTVAFDFESEKRLYQKLQSVLEPRYEQLQSLIQYRAQEWSDLCESSIRRVISLLVETAGYRLSLQSRHDKHNKQEAILTLQNDIRAAEQTCLSDLLALFSFSSKEIELIQLPVINGKWKLDLFSSNTLKLFGFNAGGSALTGAAAGASVDLMVGGLSLGAAALIGAAFGAGYSTLKRFGSDIASTILNREWLCANDTTIELIYLRSLDLLKHIIHRGHAAQKQHRLEAHQPCPLPDEWKSILRGLRSAQTDKSSLNSSLEETKKKLHTALSENVYSHLE